jgi:uncharacterized protein
MLFLATRKRLWTSILSIAIACQPYAIAAPIHTIPHPRESYGGWVTDQAEILSEQAEEQLNQMITELEKKNGTEMAVVTVFNTQPAVSPKVFATELFNYWGIGKAQTNNGVLFLVSTQERRIEIEIGYGLESLLTHDILIGIIREQIIPHYRQGDFDTGTLEGTKALISLLETQEFTSQQTSSLRLFWVGLALVLCLTPSLGIVIGRQLNRH